MSRPTSLTARQAIFAQETDEAFLILVTIDHPTLDPPIRVTSDAVDTVRGGETYVAYPFELDMPAEKDGEMVRVSLRIDNVDRQIVRTVREATGQPTVTMEIVLGSDPESLEAGPFEFSLKQASYDALLVEGTLAFEDILNEPFPGPEYTPATTPGLF